MTAPHSPAPHLAEGSGSPRPAADPNTFIRLLHSIGDGMAADGQPWPERHPLHGRRMALADADCALNGLRVVQEITLAAERARQNGEPDQYVGDRVMEGLMMACIALTAHANARMQPGG